MGVVSDEKREHSVRRIAELKLERKRLEAIIQRMEESGEVAVVSCTVQLDVRQRQDATAVDVSSHL
jgi:hypothetical protein